jgi:hypothetical protein
MVLALACRLNPSALSSLPTVSGETGCPALVRASASRAVDSVVQHNADSGSPRRVGSTSASNPATSPGSFTVAAGRPAPARRILPSGAWPDSSSVTPS